MNESPNAANTRLEREIERERDQRHKNDEAKTGVSADEEFRVKDARNNTSSADLQRPRGR